MKPTPAAQIEHAAEHGCPILNAHGPSTNDGLEEVLRGLVGNYFAAKADGLNSRTCVALQQMLEVHPPEIWAFGNYHISREFKIGGTRFRGLAELEVYELHRSDLDDLH